MRVYEGSAELGDLASGCVLTVGNFDGVHLGHQSLLRAVIERGQALGQQTALYTFDPHPRKVLSPEGSPQQLMTWDQLARALQRAGIDVLIREPFTREFASLTPEAFLRDIIRARFQADGRSTWVGISTLAKVGAAQERRCSASGPSSGCASRSSRR